jgi:hypothetical protein
VLIRKINSSSNSKNDTSSSAKNDTSGVTQGRVACFRLRTVGVERSSHPVLRLWPSAETLIPEIGRTSLRRVTI